MQQGEREENKLRSKCNLPVKCHDCLYNWGCYVAVLSEEFAKCLDADSDKQPHRVASYPVVR
jgi:hypothetical protein